MLLFILCTERKKLIFFNVICDSQKQTAIRRPPLHFDSPNSKIEMEERLMAKINLRDFTCVWTQKFINIREVA